MDMKRTVKKANNDAARRLYAPYAEAEWGFLNHWYPARFAGEVPEGSAVGVQICGVPID